MEMGIASSCLASQGGKDWLKNNFDIGGAFRKELAKGVLHRSPGFALGTPGRTLGKKHLQKTLR